MKLSKQEYEDLIRKHPNLKPVEKAHNSPICSTKQECVKGMPLVSPVQRKKKGRISTEGRLKIVYRIYAVRPMDYDNYWTKCLTDCLVEAGILEGDDWWRLCGETISEKAYSKEEERVEIEIFKL